MKTPELIRVLEEFVLPECERVLVVRMASRFFVLRGKHSEPITTFDVSQPFETRGEASQAAQFLVLKRHNQDGEELVPGAA